MRFGPLDFNLPLYYAWSQSHMLFGAVKKKEICIEHFFILKYKNNWQNSAVCLVHGAVACPDFQLKAATSPL